MAKPHEETDWQAPTIVPTTTGGAGVITMPSGLEETPCFTCKHWDKNPRKLVQFLKSRGLVPDASGNYKVRTPDLPDRRSMKINPNSWGFCRTLGMPTDMNAGAQCEYWKPTITRQDLAGKIK